MNKKHNHKFFITKNILGMMTQKETLDLMRFQAETNCLDVVDAYDFDLELIYPTYYIMYANSIVDRGTKRKIEHFNIRTDSSHISYKSSYRFCELLDVMYEIVRK